MKVGWYRLLVSSALFGGLLPSMAAQSSERQPPMVTGRAAVPGSAVRVAVYADKGSPRTPRDMQRVLGGDPAHFVVRYLSAEDIESGGLREFDVLVQGGGNSLTQSRELKAEGRDAIRSFVRGGGGYVGLCAGAHFTVPGDKLKLGILNARVVDNEHWDRGRGDVVLKFTQAGQAELKQPSQKTTVMYHQGPLLMPGDRTDLPAYTSLASYETEVARNGAPHGVMQGTDAVVSAPYGEGRVIVFSPHPEQTSGQEGMVRQAVLWASRRAEKVSFPVPTSGPTDPVATAVPVVAKTVASRPVSVAVPHAPPDSGCCGPITEEGWMLVKYLDSLNVDHLWPQHVYVDWRTGEPAPRNGHHEPKTHCSAFAAAAAMRLNIYMMRPPEHSQSELAAAQERYFQSSRGRKDGWVSVMSPQKAQELANQGEFVVLVYGDPNPHKSGHIAIVRPAIKTMDALNADGPQTIQAGGHNFSNGTAKYSFVFHRDAWPNKVMMFAHAVDFHLPPQKPATDAADLDKATDKDH